MSFLEFFPSPQEAVKKSAKDWSGLAAVGEKWPEVTDSSPREEGVMNIGLAWSSPDVCASSRWGGGFGASRGGGPLGEGGPQGPGLGQHMRAPRIIRHRNYEKEYLAASGRARFNCADVGASIYYLYL